MQETLINRPHEFVNDLWMAINATATIMGQRNPVLGSIIILGVLIALIVKGYVSIRKLKGGYRELINETFKNQKEEILHTRDLLWVSSLFELLVSVFVSVSILTNRRLLLAVYESIKEASNKKQMREAKLTATVAGLMIRSKAAANTWIYIIVFAGMIFYVCIFWLSDKPISLFPFFCLLLLLICAYFKQRVLEYRIRKGFYGSNAYEAKEIISFIVSHSEKSDFLGPDGFKSILPEADMESTYERLQNFLPDNI